MTTKTTVENPGTATAAHTAKKVANRRRAWPSQTAKKLDYIIGKLGLIPAFGDTIGREVNKAELSLCQRMAKDCEVQHTALIERLQELSQAHRELLALHGKPFGWGSMPCDEADKLIAKDNEL